MTIAAGTRLGPYEIVSPLGAGGMGEVSRARDTRLAREVAIKVLPGPVAADPERLKRFEKEARAASALNHPSIVTIYDIGQTDGVSWIAMELVDGKTLRELLASGALPVKRLLPLATSVAEGLAKAHEAGIVHRDLKPENVMVTKDGLVKILDFGLAKLTSTMSGSGEGSALPTMTGTTPGVVVGTVGYMSPEQASGEALDFRSDQFSFGSLLYEMATGKRAFLKKTAIDTLGAILNTEPEPIAQLNPEVPAPLRWIAERCLAKDPDHRYASTKDLARELASIRDHLSEATLSSAAPDRGGARRPFRLAFAAAGVLIAVATGWLVLRQGRSKATPSSVPQFEQATFGVQTIIHARFGPDGDSVVYSALIGGAPMALFVARKGSPESRSLGIAPADIASVSPSGEMAILRGEDFGTLAVASMDGGAPRDILEDVSCANWAPDGKSLAVVHVVGGKDRLEFPIGRVLREADASQGSIHGCGVSPDGSHVAFVDGKHMAVVDLAGRITRIAPWVIGMNYAWSPRGDEIWYTDYAKGVTELHATAMDGRSRILTSLPGDNVLMGVSAKGRILLENGTGETRVLGRLAGDREDRDLAWLGSSPVCIGAGGGSLLYNVGGLGYSAATSSVYLRKADGSPPVRLTRGIGQALSPDGKWAITMRNTATPPIVLTPTGAGSEKSLPDGGLIEIGWTNWLPGGSKIVFDANAAGRPSHLYVQNVTGGLPEAISPDGYTLGRHANFVSPDGRLAFARDEQGHAVLVSTQERANLPPRRIAGLLAEEQPMQWSEDAKWLYVRHRGSSTVTLLDPISGERKVWKTFATLDPSLALNQLLLTPDGSSWVRSYYRWNSNIFFLDGLK